MEIMLDLESSSATDPGVPQRANQDALYQREPANAIERIQKGSIWVIADGVGRDDSGARASSFIVQSVVDTYWNSAIPSPGARLRDAVDCANMLLVAENAAIQRAEDRPSSTVLAAAIVENRLYLAHIGRSRAYLLRDGRLQQLTEDHTWVAEQIRSGRLAPEELTHHPQRHVITRALGIQPGVPVDSLEKVVQAGDLLLLCTDGLYRSLPDEQITKLLQRHGAAAAEPLIAEAKRRDGSDNITAITLSARALPDPDSSGLERIAQINRLGRELSIGLDLDATLKSVLQQVLTLTGGERVGIMLKDATGKLTPAAATFDGLDEFAGHSHSVTEQVLRERKPLLIADALADPRFGTADSIVQRSLRSILCVPLIAQEDAIGVLCIDSSTESGIFDQTDVDLLISFATHAAAAIHNARLHQELLVQTRQLEQTRRQLDILFRSLGSALVAVDGRGNVTHWNPAAEELLGVPRDRAIGAPLAKAMPAPLVPWISNLVDQVELGRQTILTGEDWDGPLPPRQRAILSARVARIRDPEQRMTGFVIILNDHTDYMLIEEARRTERSERERLHALFSHYLAPAVVERLLGSPEAVQLGGSREDVTILFADVRGFTGFSEAHEPEDVVAVLNQYLTVATAEIFTQFGTIDKFLGDGVLAIFGAPLPVADHVMAAVRASLAMQSRMDTIRRETGIRVSFGIGLNSGQAIVGNIGTPQLMSYTAIGDVVNVAARLQVEARAGEILITQSTRDRLREQVEVEELGPLFVKGRAEPVNTYKVTGLRS